MSEEYNEQESFEIEDVEVSENAVETVNSDRVSTRPIEDETIFKPTVPQTVEDSTLSEAKKGSQAAGKMVTGIFKQGIKHVATYDQDVQDELLGTAKKVINEKVSAIANEAERESKAANFENNLDACTYFGYEEKTTSKFHVKMMAMWSWLLNTIYICTIGFFIVSPIMFILKKIKVMIQKNWLAILVALLIYALIIVIPIVIPEIVSLVENK